MTENKCKVRRCEKKIEWALKLAMPRDDVINYREYMDNVMLLLKEDLEGEQGK
ncbi:MAG TPA: hypothetical protein VI911_04930 [Patescibacteria group bacterium]|nr:hypothetical protein [Patescibacteria group bacterium]